MDDVSPSRGESPLVAEGPRARRLRARNSRARTLVLALSIGLVVLGIACIGWALTNIRAERVPSLDAIGGTALRASAATLTPVAPAKNAVVTKKPSTSSAKRVAVKVVYSKNPSEGDTLGSLSVAALGQTLPIIEGTRNSDLKKGVGHFVQSVQPGQPDNCVLSGHRDTVFSELGRLKVGDRFVVQTATGTYTYAIKRIRIVHANDRTVIVPTKHAVLTVTTCYPFDYVGSAPDRYVLVADLVTGT